MGDILWMEKYLHAHLKDGESRFKDFYLIVVFFPEKKKKTKAKKQKTLIWDVFEHLDSCVFGDH